MSAVPSCVGMVLAGGRSSRMGGGYKAFSDLGGRSMLDHVLERLKPQVDKVVVSIEPGADEFGSLRHTLVEDLAPSHRGPLSGLYASLQYLNDRLDQTWLLMVPCDAPLLPPDLGHHLHEAADATGQDVVTVRYGDRVHPTFSLWHRRTLYEVRVAALQKNLGGLMHLLDRMPHAVLEWPPSEDEQEPSPFFNVNTPEDLEQARAWLEG